MATFVIIGGGLAGAKAAETLRAERFDGDIVLFSQEAELPYERPALAKGYLLGKDSRESLFVHTDGRYAEHNVDLRSGTGATAIDPAARTVGLTAERRLTTSSPSPPAPLHAASASRAQPLKVFSTCGP